MERNEIFKTIAFSFVLIIFLGTILLTCSVILVNLDLLGINTPKQQPLIIHLTYPQENLYPREIFDTSANTLNNTPPMVTLDIALQYSGPLVAGTPVDVSAAGRISPKGEESITYLMYTNASGETESFQHYVTFGFQGATLYNESQKDDFNTPSGEFPINLEEYGGYFLRKWNASRPWPRYQTIKWDTEGDYYPIVDVPFWNKSTVRITYPDKAIHVGGPDILIQERYAKISLWLSLAFFVFTIVTSVELLFKLQPKFISDLFGIKKPSEPPISESPIKEPKIQPPKTDQFPTTTQHEQKKHKKRR